MRRRGRSPWAGLRLAVPRCHAAIKAADPTARVAIGGVTQPTPLRLRCLETVLAAYREQSGAEMPVDVWNVHNFILWEEPDAFNFFLTAVDPALGYPVDGYRLVQRWC